MADTLISLRNISKTYKMGKGLVKAVDGVSLKIKEGEFVAIVGTSGSGKSTLMNLIGGLDFPTEGRITVDGVDISKLGDQELSVYRSREVGFVFQQFHLRSSFTALENVIFPLYFNEDIPKAERLERAKAVLEAVGLGDRTHHKANELSGGERQRVCIARALVSEPVILIADEPTGNLDSKTGDQIMDLLSDLNKKKGVTLVIVTHDMDVAKRAKRKFVMKDGQLSK